MGHRERQRRDGSRVRPGRHLEEVAGSCQACTCPSPIAEPHQSLPRNLGEVIPVACGGRILPHCAATERARDERVGAWDRNAGGVDPQQAGSAGSHHPAPRVPRSSARDCPPGGLEAMGTTRALLHLDAISARRSQVAGRRQCLALNPDRMARLRSHYTPSTGFGIEASPCRSPRGPDCPTTGPSDNFARPWTRSRQCLYIVPPTPI